ncbi:MAG: RNA pseudouridine synthase [Bdellovibrio sp.]|nr:MAG: RNA pseudouridine synthase [Bdellovibrio sp.]
MSGKALDSGAVSGLTILFEDEDLIAVNKPAGLLSQASWDPKRPHVVADLKNRFGIEAILHHRLDRDTSGVLLLTKNQRLNAAVTDLFRQHKIEKVYWALCNTAPSQAWQDQRIENHLAPVRDSAKQLQRMKVVRSGGWQAVTELRLIAHGPAAHGPTVHGPIFDWVEAKPLTGRTHQIRVHLAGLQRPILGDPLYGGRTTMIKRHFPHEVNRTLLHARSLRLTHPRTQQELQIEAPLPADMEALTRLIGHE